MAVTPNTEMGTTNSTTRVEVAAGQASGTRTILKLVVSNQDSSAITVIVERRETSTYAEIGRAEVDASGGFVVWDKDDIEVLAGTTEGINIKLTGSPGTEADYTVTYVDKS